MNGSTPRVYICSLLRKRGWRQSATTTKGQSSPTRQTTGDQGTTPGRTVLDPTETTTCHTPFSYHSNQYEITATCTHLGSNYHSPLSCNDHTGNQCTVCSFHGFVTDVCMLWEGFSLNPQRCILECVARCCSRR